MLNLLNVWKGPLTSLRITSANKIQVTPLMQCLCNNAWRLLALQLAGILLGLVIQTETFERDMVELFGGATLCQWTIS